MLLILVFSGLSLGSLRQLKGDACAGSGHCELDGDLGGEVVCREVGSHFRSELQLVGCQLIDEWVDSKRCGVLAIDAVVHDQELSIRWVDRHCLHGFEVSSINALVEVAVIQGDTAI